MKRLAIHFGQTLLVSLLLGLLIVPQFAQAGQRTRLPVCAAMSLKDAVTDIERHLRSTPSRHTVGD